MAHGRAKIPKDETARLREEFDNLRTDFLSLAQELKAYAEHEQHAFEDRASDRVVALRAASERQLEAAKGYALDAAKAAENGVREHPGYAVAGAAALGFLIGAFTTRRR